MTKFIHSCMSSCVPVQGVYTTEVVKEIISTELLYLFLTIQVNPLPIHTCRPKNVSILLPRRRPPLEQHSRVPGSSEEK
jgi:hypothetical protein